MREHEGWAVNVESSVPVYKQIENQVQFGISSGRLKSGDSLPSVRDMSEGTGVNPNTVTKAYRDLELLGIVATRRGVGVTITSKNQKKHNDSTKQMARDHLREAAAECLFAGCSTAELKAIVADVIKSKSHPYDTRT